MRRPAHGATSRPGPSRPASGYGRALGRPGPRADGPIRADTLMLDPAIFVELLALLERVERETEVVVPLTP